MSSAGIRSVDALTESLRDLLQRSNKLKPDGGIEPVLTSTSFSGDVESIIRRAEGGITVNAQDQYAALETACRNIFYDLLASTSIEETSFSQIWNLLDIVSLLSDIPLCEPGLVFWLVEELLDSQTIDGCRVVFDYLDSRRERLTAKHFKQKQLIILRACNELLRRLSRAEDTVFCGRVFIFMFQSFPLGDRSSVNLRGEYHVENVTVFDPTPANDAMTANSLDGAMDVDQAPDAASKEKPVSSDLTGTAESGGQSSTPQPTDNITKTVTFDAEEDKTQEPEPDTETLYPIFWSLQDVFSQPTRLFETSTFESFKKGLDVTFRKFKAVQRHQQSRGTSKVPSAAHRPLKRKRAGIDSDQQDLAGSFNPRYLTSRDLFDLEISDLAFRRHILVQGLILVDFLLSLTPKAKKKLENTSNKSVLYNYTLPEEEIKWATAMRADIAVYLQQGQEGKFYYRMVDTVLSRDKNWAQWKAEGCPLIKQPPIAAASFIESQKGAQKTSAPKRIRPTPMGSLDLNFLMNTGDEGQAHGLEILKKPARYTLPKVEDFKGPIMEDEFDLDMAKTEEEKESIGVAKASKLWRTLRIASKNRLNLFDKLEEGNGLGPLFDPPPATRGQDVDPGRKEEMETERTVAKDNMEVSGVKDGVAMESVPPTIEVT
ncbi:MAG: hypothetical protein Q9168_001469 [Polycauliona sp. 1 TL-2023]